MTAERLIDYDALAQDAMRGVVRAVLARAAKSGLPGDHHFYVSFDTQIPGVSLSKRLKEKYPEEMTIVLQHRFWDLAVTDERFEVKLTFDGIPERLVVPFAAIKVFFDPSVRYGLQFDGEPEADAPAHAAGGRLREIGSATSLDAMPESGAPGSRPQRLAPERKPRPARKTRADKSTETTAPAERPAMAKPAETGRPKPVPASSSRANNPPAAPASGGAEIVSLDAFRKK